MKQQKIEELLQGRFDIDCTRIKLTPCIQTSKKRPLLGSGYIALNKDGHFDLKVYFSDAFPIDEVFKKFSWEPGKVLDDEAYYDLIAYDIAGDVWRAHRFIPEKIIGPRGSMIIGKISEITKIEENHASSNKGFIQLHFNKVIKVPLNTPVEEVKTVGESTREMKTNIGIARFKACEINFEIEEIEGHTKLSAMSDLVIFTDVTINRIFESFSFVTSNSESWSIMINRNPEKIETRVRAVKSRIPPSRIPPPISYQTIQDSGVVWVLFECYLTYVLANETDYLHPVSQENHAVIESGKASLDVEALTLSVSIESLLREELISFYPVSPDLSNNIAVAIDLVKESEKLDENFKKRTIGSLSAMKNARSKDVLFALRDEGLIDEALVKTYGIVRNKSAHGTKSYSGDVQNYYNQVSALRVLFFQLVFLVIKYSGEYTDYGTCGYPSKQFSGKRS